MSIPFNQLWTTREDAREPLAAAMERVLRSGRYILGAEVEAFEEEFSAYLGVTGGVGVASGTDALTLALLAGRMEPGAEVLLPAFGSGATITGILAAGATPVPVDVEWDFTLDQNRLEEALTPRTRALVAVHLYGKPDRIIALRRFTQTHGLWLVEDCAQAHGAEVWDPGEERWKKTGTFGDAAAFSFYPTKNLGALGDAGFCVVRTAAGTEKLRSLRQYGWRRRDKATQVGRNSRMDELQAAVLRIGLPAAGRLERATQNACAGVRHPARRLPRGACCETARVGRAQQKRLPPAGPPGQQTQRAAQTPRGARRWIWSALSSNALPTEGFQPVCPSRGLSCGRAACPRGAQPSPAPLFA